MTATFNLIRIEGTGDSPVAVVKIHPGDGSEWWLLILFTMRGDKIAKMLNYSAPLLTPAEWRAPWVERLVK